MIFERQDYQEDCIENILGVYSDLDREDKASYEEKCQTLEASLKRLHEETDYPLALRRTIRKLRLDVLMETGTGKTFTYLNLMLALDKAYGVKKFIIFVPRRAILEGIIQNIRLTANHFRQSHQKDIAVYRYEGRLDNVRSYVRHEDELSVLILTNSSVDKNINILRKMTERMMGKRVSSPLDAISNVNPIVIIDEPHLLKGVQFTKVYEEFFPLSLCVRFGATFPSEDEHALSNVIYHLDSLAAHHKYLVKQIHVKSFWNAVSGLRFYNVDRKKKTVETVTVNNNEERLYKIRYGKGGDDIGVRTQEEFYRGVRILNVKGRTVYLSNGDMKELSKESYTISEDIMQQMISDTIKEHFLKEETLFKQKIKALALFFIPEIKDFRGEEPRIKGWFEAEYTRQRKCIIEKTKSESYKAFLQKDIDESGTLRVHDGYFSGDKGTKEDKEADAVNLILKDKERLLSLEEPLRFIFSVWALQEGWDNPNVFTLCKLACTKAETSKRQQVGRGLRIAVNQSGNRQTIDYLEGDSHHFHEINHLDVIVSGQEKAFIEGIQEEIRANSFGIVGGFLKQEDFFSFGLQYNQVSRLITYMEDNGILHYDTGREGYAIKKTPEDFFITQREQLLTFMDAATYKTLLKNFRENKEPPVKRAQAKRPTVGVRLDRFKDFKDLWHAITRRATYHYGEIEEKKLISKVKENFDKEDIHPDTIRVETKYYDGDTDSIIKERIEEKSSIRFLKTSKEYVDFALKIADELKCSIPFIISLMNRMDFTKIANDPKKAKDLIKTFVREAIHGAAQAQIHYDFTEITMGTEARKFFYEADEKTVRKEVLAGDIGRDTGDAKPPDHYLYDRIFVDSKIEETIITGDPHEVNERTITVFGKLPRIIKIPTPYKNYSPDFAYCIREGKRSLFLVIEAKGYDKREDIPENEQRKISYAEKFFRALEKRMKTEDNPVEILFKTRINKEGLADVLRDITKHKKGDL